MHIIATVALEDDDTLWLHVSFSRDRMPDYSDITFIKQQFFGDHFKAIMVFPAKNEHVNIHPNCLHLWSNLESDILPDFRVAGIGI